MLSPVGLPGTVESVRGSAEATPRTDDGGTCVHWWPPRSSVLRWCRNEDRGRRDPSRQYPGRIPLARAAHARDWSMLRPATAAPRSHRPPISAERVERDDGPRERSHGRTASMVERRGGYGPSLRPVLGHEFSDAAM